MVQFQRGNQRMIPEYDKCSRCGRRLKNPESRRLGFGVVCYSKVQTRRERVPLFSMEAKIDEDDKGGNEKANRRTSKNTRRLC